MELALLGAQGQPGDVPRARTEQDALDRAAQLLQSRRRQQPLLVHPLRLRQQVRLEHPRHLTVAELPGSGPPSIHRVFG